MKQVGVGAEVITEQREPPKQTPRGGKSQGPSKLRQESSVPGVQRQRGERGQLRQTTGQ